MGMRHDLYTDIENEPVEIRLARAKVHKTSPEVLRRLSKDRFWFVRDFVASNPNTPIECLEALTCDADFRVRQEAINTLEAKTVHLSLSRRIQNAEHRISSNSKCMLGSMDFER